MYHVTDINSKKVIKLITLTTLKQKIEESLNITLEDKLLQYFDKCFQDWVDIDNDSNFPKKARIRVISIDANKTSSEMTDQPSPSQEPNMTDLENDLEQLSTSKERNVTEKKTRFNWKNDEGKVTEHFKDTIQAKIPAGKHGKLPDEKEIQEFLESNPEIKADVKIVRTKISNERQKNKNQLKEQEGQEGQT